LVEENDKHHGGATSEQYKNECPSALRDYVFNPSKQEQILGIGRPVHPWSRLPQYQTITMRLIIEAVLISSPAFEGALEVPLAMADDLTRSTFDLSHRLLYTTENNPGAAREVDEMKNVLKNVKTTTKAPREIQEALDRLAKSKRTFKSLRTKIKGAVRLFNTPLPPTSGPVSLATAKSADTSEDVVGFAQVAPQGESDGAKVAFKSRERKRSKEFVIRAVCLSKPTTPCATTPSPLPSPPPPSAATEQQAVKEDALIHQSRLPAPSKAPGATEVVQAPSSSIMKVVRRASHSLVEDKATAAAGHVHQAATAAAEGMATAAAGAVHQAATAAADDIYESQRRMINLTQQAAAALTHAHHQPTHFLLYLNDESWLGEQGERLACEVRAALHMKLPIAMIHEVSPERGGCDFDKFFAVTPSDLVRDGLYNRIATAVPNSEAHRELGFLLFAKDIGGSRREKEAGGIAEAAASAQEKMEEAAGSAQEMMAQSARCIQRATSLQRMQSSASFEWIQSSTQQHASRMNRLRLRPAHV